MTGQPFLLDHLLLLTILTEGKTFAKIDTDGMYGGDGMARNKYPEETVNLIVEKSLELFVEKGYENTSIQEIINRLGGLSKGAIYHHFKSKEEIFHAVCEKIGKDNERFFAKIRDDESKTGYEKLLAMLQSAYRNPSNQVVIAMTSQILRDPKFMCNQVMEIFEVVAPNYVQPVLEQGMRDGSIKTEYPKELAEVLITLLNIWINPIIATSTLEQMRRKLDFLNLLLSGIGLAILDEEMIQSYVAYIERYQEAGETVLRSLR